MGNKLRSILITAIISVWGVDYLASLLVRGYQPPSQLNAAALTLVGTLIATYRKEDKKDDDSE